MTGPSSDGPAGTDRDQDVQPADDSGRRSGRRSGLGGARGGGGFGEGGSGRRSKGAGGGGGRGDGGFGRGKSGRASGPQWSSRSTDADGAPAEMEDPEAVAKGICLRALTGTAKTRKQLADLLAKKEVPAEVADAVLDRFTDVGLIDDAAFAAAWVSTRQSGRGLARRALASELRAKGVDGDIAAAAVAEVDPQAEWDSARALVARKMPSMQRLDRVTAERRLMGMLARKGYGGGLAGYVVREALDDAGKAEDAAAEAEPFDDDEPSWSPAEAPVWTAARSAARSALRSTAPAASFAGSASTEVGEGQARRIGRTPTGPAGPAEGLADPF
ncbi:regulatory protein RecX [Modestobacter muralis]|uniref:Regulatory protein RecX n=1 Tax=Modestobacter muralis TaxID=1608614 RepID=A0A6P0H1L2_9ACTN|nr:regulatory protein RecX [Modestobacter muralis]NEK92592.1 regulatory protein RecX [Modestobacter muralis]NEN49359.1 regulatory protein RecX [Modestobacter muralis]